MAHIGLSHIENALKKSGLPFGGADQMNEAAPYAGFALNESIPRTDVGDMGYREKLAQIAKMDQKLSGLYSDPTSGMFIENPMARENLLGGANNQQYQEAGDIFQRKQAAQEEADKNREDLIKESEKYYDTLIAIQEREEKALKKGSGKKRKVTAIEEMAGFQDPEAAMLWSKQLSADQKRRWLQMVLEGEIDENTAPGIPVPTEIPEDGFSTQDVLNFFDAEKAVKIEEKRVKEETKAVEKQKKDKKSTAATLQELLDKID